uniref:AMP-dependent synthetase and ligase domain containing protein n=1 Tax=Haemonchus contortus TaxID=6289 RepID=A0A7I4XUN7_HAECO|nr:AMP-dependent synthetase ligase domain containing protein [Haemonchus contortus]
MLARWCCRLRSILTEVNAVTLIHVRGAAASFAASNLPLHEKVIGAIRCHAEDPGKIALISPDCEAEILTYRDLLHQTEATASYLSENGFAKGDVALFVMENSSTFAVSHLGVLKCGGTITSASPSSSRAALEHQIRDSKASLIFTEEAILPRVMLAAQECCNVKKIVCERSSPSDSALPERVEDFKNVIDGPVNKVDIHTSSSDLAVLPYTDVMKEAPMGMILTHQNVSTAVDIYQAYMERMAKKVLKYPDCSQESLLLCSSFASMYGLLCLNIALIMGFTSVILKKFEPLLVFNSVRSYRPRILVAEPAQIVSLLKQPTDDDFMLSSIQYVLCGGPPIGKRVRKLFLERFTDVKYMTNGAGSLEGAPGAMIPNIVGRENYNDVGCSVPIADMKVVCPSTGELKGLEEKGEVCLRGPTVMQGYMNDSAQLNEDGWYQTGQVGYVDKYGKAFISGRQRDMVEIDGQQVSLTELEDVLLSHPSISDAAVISTLDEGAAQKMKAFVVQCDEKLTAEDVLGFVDGQAAPIFKSLLSGVEFVYRIPRGTDGYPLRNQLQQTVDQKEVEDVIAS